MEYFNKYIDIPDDAISSALKCVRDAVIQTTYSEYSKLASLIADKVLEEAMEFMYYEILSRSMEAALEVARSIRKEYTVFQSAIQLSQNLYRGISSTQHMADIALDLVKKVNRVEGPNVSALISFCHEMNVPTNQPAEEVTEENASNTVSEEDELRLDIESITNSSSNNWQQRAICAYRKWSDRNPVFAIIINFLLHSVSDAVIAAFVTIAFSGMLGEVNEVRIQDESLTDQSVTCTIYSDSTVEINGTPPYYFDIEIDGERDICIEGYISSRRSETSNLCVTSSDVSFSDVP